MYYPRSYPPPPPRQESGSQRTITIVALVVVAVLFVGGLGTFGACVYVAGSALSVPDDRVGVLTGAQLPDDIVRAGFVRKDARDRDRADERRCALREHAGGRLAAEEAGRGDRAAGAVTQRMSLRRK